MLTFSHLFLVAYYAHTYVLVMILFSNLKAFAVPYTHRAYASVSPVLAHTCMSNLVSRMLPQTVKGIKW